MLSPLPKPDTVPMHPVRDILERSNKAGLTFKFEPLPCSEEGCTALMAIVDGVPLGRCAGTVRPQLAGFRHLGLQEYAIQPDKQCIRTIWQPAATDVANRVRPVQRLISSLKMLAVL